MAFSVTLGELVSACQERANQVGAEQIAVTEWKALISERYGRIHTAVTDAGARYFESEVTLNLAALALPSNHKATVGVDFQISSAGARRQLPELMIHERDLFSGLTGEARAWSFIGTALQLYPLPTSGTYLHIYVPQPTRYNTSADSTSIDLITTDGYEAVLWGVASVALHRSESAQQRAIAESDAALGRLKEWSVQRALTMPRRRQVADIMGGPGGFGSIYGAWNPASWRYR